MKRIRFDALVPGEVFQVASGERFTKMPSIVAGTGFNAIDFQGGRVRCFGSDLAVERVGRMAGLEWDLPGIGKGSC